MPLILKRDPIDKTPNRLVLFEGAEVGCIFDRVPGAAAPHKADAAKHAAKSANDPTRHCQRWSRMAARREIYTKGQYGDA